MKFGLRLRLARTSNEEPGPEPSLRGRVWGTPRLVLTLPCGVFRQVRITWGCYVLVNGDDLGSQLALNFYPDDKSITLGNMTLGSNEITIGGANDSLGFFGATPVTQPDPIENVVGTTKRDLREKIAEILQVLRDYGLIGSDP